ncbi:TlpA family protein disulfide reductase [Mucilaginibacter sp.]|uniref:TlpA family protein disulfide reductase n=1 Tax=Mucilaginibacter sp. TaxID=1882438 RepID=UPI003D0C4369
MKLKISLLLFLCPFFWVYVQAQNTKTAGVSGSPVTSANNNIAANLVTGLQVGDRVPSVAIPHIINNDAATISLAALRGKLVILDFWATNCGSCVRALPRLDSLQARFGDSIAIICVSYEKAAIVRSFLMRNPIGRALKLPVATEDLALKALFPHRILSHEVWIEPGGLVRAITEPEYVTEKNIEAILHHRDISLPVKTDLAAFDYNKPLFAGTPPVFYSAISVYKPGVAPKFGISVDSIKHTIRLFMYNFPVLQFYMLATDHLLYFPKTLQDFELTDQSIVRVPPGTYRDAWRQRHMWCYETVLSADLSDAQIRAAMIADLNKFFHLNGRMEKKKTLGLSLERIGSDTSMVSTKGGVPTNTLHSHQGVKELINASLSNVIWELNDLPGGLPAIDNTGINGNVDLRLPISSFSDTSALNTALKPFGLILREKQLEPEFFILSDAAKAN